MKNYYGNKIYSSMYDHKWEIGHTVDLFGKTYIVTLSKVDDYCCSCSLSGTKCENKGFHCNSRIPIETNFQLHTVDIII